MIQLMDHEMTSLVARAASFIYTAPNISLHPLRKGSGVPYPYYCDPLEATDPFGKIVQPTTRVNVTAQLDRKAQMLACHTSQRAWFLAHHGIDEYLESMKRHAAMRGREIGAAAAEAFVRHRGNAYPQDDILAEIDKEP